MICISYHISTAESLCIQFKEIALAGNLPFRQTPLKDFSSAQHLLANLPSSMLFARKCLNNKKASEQAAEAVRKTVSSEEHEKWPESHKLHFARSYPEAACSRFPWKVVVDFSASPPLLILLSTSTYADLQHFQPSPLFSAPVILWILSEQLKGSLKKSGVITHTLKSYQ